MLIYECFLVSLLSPQLQEELCLHMGDNIHMVNITQEQPSIYKIVIDYQKKFHKDRCIDARARAVNARARVLSRVVSYYLMNLIYNNVRN